MTKKIPKSVYIVSLGCSKNFVDTEISAASLLQAGFGITDNPDDASVFLINTCAFIAPARAEAESVITDAVNWKNQASAERKIIVSGCLVQKDRDGSVRAKYPSVDLWLGIDEAKNNGTLIKQLFGKIPASEKLIASEKPVYIYDDLTPRLQLTLPHYAYLKIADGCSNMCSYCSIPAIRGTLRSRTIKSVVSEAQNLLKNGVVELIVIAQDISAFAADNKTSGENLEKLLRALDALDGDFSLRLMYAHPRGITESLIQTIASSKHIMPYIDLPLQHISDNILKSMNRKVSSAYVKKTIAMMRSIMPQLTLRTTFLLGYPGETEDNFKELCDFVNEQRFERLGVFAYSPEEGTKAFDLKGRVPAGVAQKRVEKLMKIQSKISLNMNKALVGKIFDVIVDSVEKNTAFGRTYMDAPEVDNAVEFVYKGRLEAGTVVRVEMKSCSEYDIKGVMLGGGDKRK